MKTETTPIDDALDHLHEASQALDNLHKASQAIGATYSALCRISGGAYGDLFVKVDNYTKVFSVTETVGALACASAFDNGLLQAELDQAKATISQMEKRLTVTKAQKDFWEAQYGMERRRTFWDKLWNK